MRKLVTLLLAAGLVFTASQPAAAAEFKPFMQADFMFEMSTAHGLADGTFGYQSTSDFNHNYGNLGAATILPDGSVAGTRLTNMHNKGFYPTQRFLIGGSFIASENLSAYFDVIGGFFTWGGPSTNVPGPGSGGALGSRAANIYLRQAYLDWMIPSTDIKVRMGQQMWVMPAFSTGNVNPTSGNEFGSGILVNAPINENVGLTVGWLRAASGPRRGTHASFPASDYADDNMDMFLVTVPLKFEGIRVTPWATVALIGKDEKAYPAAYSWTHYSPLPSAAYQGLIAAGKDKTAGLFAKNAGNLGVARGNSTAYWLGLGGEITMFDPFRFAMDINYSGINTKHSAFDRSGWLVSAAASYKTQYGVPTLKAWYATGDDSNPNNGSERPLSTGGFNPGASSFFGSGGLAGPVFWDVGNGRSGGTWGVSMQWNNASFISDMFHNFRVTYVQGTNAKSNAYWADPRSIDKYLTKGDSIVEFDFETSYSIYKNLVVITEMSYIIQNFDGNLWAKYRPGDINSDPQLRTPGVTKFKFSNSWRMGVNLRYMF